MTVILSPFALHAIGHLRIILTDEGRSG